MDQFLWFTRKPQTPGNQQHPKTTTLCEPSKSKFPGRLQRFYIGSINAFVKAFLTGQTARNTGKSGIIAPPMTWSGERYTRGYVDDRTNQLEAESSANTKNMTMQDHASENVIMSLEHDATCPFPDHSQWQAFINKRDIYTWNHTDSLRNSTQSNSLLQVVHLPSNVPWNMSLHS